MKSNTTEQQRTIKTKKKILNAARKLFATNGFDGTSISKLADKAGINKSLIFHHFTDKANLWRAVKHDAVAEFEKKQTIMPSTDLKFKAFISELFYNQMAFYQSSPELIRMFNWQRLKLKNHDIKSTNTNYFGLWESAFKQYQKQGDINKKYELTYVTTFVLSIIYSASLDMCYRFETKRSFKTYCEFCIETILRGLK